MGKKANKRGEISSRVKNGIGIQDERALHKKGRRSRPGRHCCSGNWRYTESQYMNIYPLIGCFYLIKRLKKYKYDLGGIEPPSLHKWLLQMLWSTLPFELKTYNVIIHSNSRVQACNSNDYQSKCTTLSSMLSLFFLM